MKSPVSRSAAVDLDDQARIKFALTALGYYNDTQDGLSPYGSDSLFEGIKRYQKAKSLQVDGVINPDGDTHMSIKASLENAKDASGAFTDFVKNYFEMREANWKESDEYFHCKANYEAAKRGWNGGMAAQTFSNSREQIQRDLGQNLKDEIDDQTANHYGRGAARRGDFQSAREACEIYRPKNGFPDKY